MPIAGIAIGSACTVATGSAFHAAQGGWASGAVAIDSHPADTFYPPASDLS